MKMAFLCIAGIALAVSGSMAADAGRKLKYDYVPSCYEPQTLLACGAQAGLECYDAGGSDASCSEYFCCTPPAEGTDTGSGAGTGSNPNPVPYPYVPTCYEPQTQLACGAQAGLECYDAGGSDDKCSEYFCCTPAAAGRKLSQVTVSGVDGSNYQSVADSYQNEAKSYEAAAQATSESYQNQNYSPPRVPTCYAPYSNLACGAQTGLDCYDAGGSDDNCSAYFCCQPQ